MTTAIEVADTTLLALIGRVENSEKAQLLKGGKTVATLVPNAGSISCPPRTPGQMERAPQALRDMDALRSERKLGPFNFEEFKADRDCGRR